MTKSVIVPTYRADIFIAGDRADAERICKAFCMEGLCVTVTPTEFIYTAGAEPGVRVGLINYPRFPAARSAIRETALRLTETLLDGLYQHSASVVADDETVWVTRRPQDNG